MPTADLDLSTADLPTADLGLPNTGLPNTCLPPQSSNAGLWFGGEEGSLITEYGLLAVVGATIAGIVISWAGNGALVTLFNALLRHARGLVGA